MKVFISCSKEKKEKISDVIEFAKDYLEIVDNEQDADVIYVLDKKPELCNKKIIEVTDKLISKDIYKKMLDPAYEIQFDNK